MQEIIKQLDKPRILTKPGGIDLLIHSELTDYGKELFSRVDGVTRKTSIGSSETVFRTGNLELIKSVWFDRDFNENLNYYIREIKVKKWWEIWK